MESRIAPSAGATIVALALALLMGLSALGGALSASRHIAAGPEGTAVHVPTVSEISPLEQTSTLTRFHTSPAMFNSGESGPGLARPSLGQFTYNLEDENWGGYVYCPPQGCEDFQNPTSSTAVLTVSATWTVPYVNGTTTTDAQLESDAMSTWVGIGGFGTSDLMQVGVEEDWDGPGPPTTWESYAWWTMDYTPTELFSTAPGDRIFAEVSYDGINSGGQQLWVFTIDDITNGHSFGSAETCVTGSGGNCAAASGFESADWVIEAPGGPPNGCPVAQLPAYNKVPFYNPSVGTTSGQTSLSAEPSDLVNDLAQSYAGLQGVTSQGVACDYILQDGEYDSAILGTGTSTTFYGQYLLDVVDGTCASCSVSPTAAPPGVDITGTYYADNPSGAEISQGVNNPSGSDFSVNVGLEMGLQDAGGASTSSVGVQSTPDFALSDPSNYYVYVSNYGTDTVSVIQGTSSIATLTVGIGPLVAAFDPTNGYVFVPNSGSNTVSVISGTTVLAGDTLSVGTNPHSVEYDSANGEIYVTDYGSGNVYVFGGTNDLTQEAIVSVGSGPLFAIPAGNYLYVGNTGGSTVSVINAATNAVTSVSTGTNSNPHSATYDPVNGYVYVPLPGTSGQVAIFSGTVLEKTLTIGGDPAFAGYDPSNGYIYVPNDDGNEVAVLSGTSILSGSPVNTYPETYPVFAVYDSANRQMYITDTGSSAVTVIGGTTGLVITSPTDGISVGSTPWSLVYDSGNNLLYVPNSASGTVSVLNPAGAPSCYDPTDSSSVNNGLVILAGTNPVTTKLDVCSGLPAGTYAYEYLVWWVYGSHGVAGQYSQLLGTSGWSYSWKSFVTVQT
jgi:YVTN family beta-propeller protein